MLDDNDCLNIPNIHCFAVLRSLCSRKFVSEVFCWQWHYYTLKTDGIKYLREYLGLPNYIIPNTLKADRNQKREDEDDGQEVEGGDGEDNRGRRGNRGGRGGRGTPGSTGGNKAKGSIAVSAGKKMTFDE